jgi:hypothetical protein
MNFRDDLEKYIRKLKEDYNRLPATRENEVKFYFDLDNYNSMLYVKYNVKRPIVGIIDIPTSTVMVGSKEELL